MSSDDDQCASPVRRDWVQQEAPSPQRQAALAEFSDLVKRMLSMGFRQSELAKTLTGLVVEASKGLPPSRVLYCASYGGFGYSDHFKQFKKGLASDSATPTQRCKLIPSLVTLCAAQRVSVSLRSRLTNVALVQAYGQHIFEQHPAIGRLAYAYLAGVGAAMQTAYAYTDSHNTLDVTRMRLQQLDEALKEAPGSDSDWSKLEHYLSHGRMWVPPPRLDGLLFLEKPQAAIDFAPYTQQAREEMRVCLAAACEALGTAHTKAHGALHAKLLTACGGDSSMAEQLVASLHEKLPGKVPWAQQQPRKSRWEEEEPTFAEALAQHGDHWAVWQCQAQFSVTPIHSLIKRPQVLDKLLAAGMADAQVLARCYEQLGLAAASTRFCKLAIKEVPQLAEWRIHEYDGSESVQLL